MSRNHSPIFRTDRIVRVAIWDSIGSSAVGTLEKNELSKYMRGDSTGKSSMKEPIHTHYEDIEELYRENIYRLGI